MFDNMMVSTTESAAANKMMVAMVQADPDGAQALLSQAGYSAEEIKEILAGVVGKIKYHAVQESLELFRKECTTLATSIISDLPSLDEYGNGDEIEEVAITIKGAREVRKLDSGAEEIGDWTWEAATLTKVKGQKRMTGGSTKRASGGGGGKPRVPVPDELKEDGIKSWKALLERDHPEEFVKAESGASYSACVWLARLKNPHYVTAKEAMST